MAKMKYPKLIFAMVIILSIWPGCDNSNLYLTEVNGKLDMKNSCASEFPSHIYVIALDQQFFNHFVADSISVEQDGSFYHAFAGAEFLQWQSDGDCADSYYLIAKGKSQKAIIRPIGLTDSITLKIDQSMFHPDAGSIIIELTRLHRKDRNTVRQLSIDQSSFKRYFNNPLDTLLRFRLALDQEYHFRISESIPQSGRREIVPLRTIKASKDLREIFL
jgi:hypothetical protein